MLLQFNQRRLDTALPVDDWQAACTATVLPHACRGILVRQLAVEGCNILVQEQLLIDSALLP